MTIELPVLRLGLAGFSPAEQGQIAAALPAAASGTALWEIASLPDADAWWVSGARAKLLPGDTVQVTPGAPTERTLRLHLPDIDRPVAFSLPLACGRLAPAYSFDAASRPSMGAVLEKFEAWLSPLTAQFCLASLIVEHQAALGNGVFDVGADGRLLAVVNMHGDAAVLPGAGPADFEDAAWSRRDNPVTPRHMVSASMSQLMWQYTTRSKLDLLPRHYRTEMLYFRRAPRLPQRMLGDSHLLLIRELAGGPAGFDTLHRRTGIDARQLARDLAALYFVGSITSNPKRAATGQVPRTPGDCDSMPHSSLPSGLDTVLPRGRTPARPIAADLTAPAWLGPR
jgi:hypothetical protein